MGIKKTYEEINEKIKKGKAIILTAEEVTKLACEKSPAEIARTVDVITTATFGPMCSSGIFINFGHPDPPVRMEKIKLNQVPAHAGIAAVDAYLGATAESVTDIKYGGAHVIEALIKGEKVELQAWGKGTDCYPGKEDIRYIDKDSVNEIFMFNPRNAYQNYSVAVNCSDSVKYTYMGILLPGLGNAMYSTSGELSPLLNDPDLRTIGIGTRIFLGGTQGYVSWNGTQFNTGVEKNQYGIPIKNAATIAVIGDLKKMSSEYIKAAYFEKYGVSLFVGIGIPIPVLDEEIAARVSVSNRQIETSIFDYGSAGKPQLGITNYEELQSGSIRLNGKKIRTAPLSSIKKARQIARVLKEQISSGEFLISKPVQQLNNKNLK